MEINYLHHYSHGFQNIFVINFYEFYEFYEFYKTNNLH